MTTTPYAGNRPYRPTKDFRELGLPYDVTLRLGELRRREPRILVVNMFDPREIKQEYALNAIDMLGLITKTTIGVTTYARIQEKDPEVENPAVMVLTGKYTNFTDYMEGGRFYAPGESFDDRFSRLIEIIKGTKIPLLLLCAGAQLYGMAMCGNDKLKDLDERVVNPEQKRRIEGLFGILQVHAHNHPLFANFNELPISTDSRLPKLHYCHSQYLDLQVEVADSSPGVNENQGVRVLAWHDLPKDIFPDNIPKVIPTVLEHADGANPSKHRLGFQCHPEWLPTDPELLEQNPGGLVLLINALHLLTDPENYTKEKVRLYDPTGTPLTS